MAQWYYAQGGQQVGPIEADQLRQLLATGQVNPADLVWNETMADWAEARAVPELAGEVVPLAPTVPLSYGVQSYPITRPVNGPNHQSLATTALVLACLSLLCFGFILAPTGLIMGIVARNNMKRDGNSQGSGIALAAIIVGSLVSAMYLVGIAAVVARHR